MTDQMNFTGLHRLFGLYGESVDEPNPWTHHKVAGQKLQHVPAVQMAQPVANPAVPLLIAGIIGMTIFGSTRRR